MSLLPTLGSVFDAGSGLLLLALGLFVALVKPRRRANAYLAGFSVGLGMMFLLGNLFDPTDPEGQFLLSFNGLFGALAAVAVALLAATFPRPVPRGQRALVLGVPLAAYALPTVLAVASILLVQGTLPSASPVALVGTLLSPINAMRAAVLVFALRFALGGGPAEARDRAQYALLGAALLLFPSVVAGENLVIAARGATPLLLATRLANLAVLLGTAALWLRNAAASEGRLARLARDAALVGPALAVVGMGAALAFTDSGNSGVRGLARTASVAVLAYAILRHQLLDIDLKVKWTIRQSTVAAAFIGVFFVVSESASTFFANDAGLGAYVGIAAAGVLVFAIAPLQRAAERVASAAMPGVKAPGEMSRDDRHALYRDQVALAWADGALDKGERALLGQLRERLGLSLEEARRLEEEAVAR